VLVPAPAATADVESTGPQAQQKPPVSGIPQGEGLPAFSLTDPSSGTTFLGNLEVNEAFEQRVSVRSKNGRVDRLSNEEYKRLTDAEAALAKVKTDIAAAHGVQFSVSRSQATCAASDLGQSLVRNDDAVPSIKGDTYEFRGQFLLVDIPEVR